MSTIPIIKSLPLQPKAKSALEQFLERLYRLNTSKYGRDKELFIVVETPMEIQDVVALCKKYCNLKQMRFLGVTPLFEFIPISISDEID